MSIEYDIFVTIHIYNFKILNVIEEASEPYGQEHCCAALENIYQYKDRAISLEIVKHI